MTIGVIGLVSALGLSGCLGGGSGDDATYTPLPDDELFAQVEQLPHVEKADCTAQDSFSNGPSYTCALVTDGVGNPLEAIDRAAAVLWQGREGALLLVSVDADPAAGIDRTYRLDEIASSAEQLRARYGPQPGGGLPPSNQPVPTPTDWTPLPSPAS